MQSGEPETVARDLRAMVADGILFSVMVGVGESYVPAFVMALGHGEVAAGLIASVPVLVGAGLQLVSPAAVRRLGSYRRWVVLCARLQAASFLPLVAGAAWGALDIAWIAAAMVAYWAFGMATGPAWNAWVTSLVPSRIRARFFAHRTRLAQASLMASLVGAGLALDVGRDRGASLAVFGLLFGVALAARLGSSLCLARQSEAPELASHHRALSLPELGREMNQRGTRRLLGYLLAMQLAVNVAAPYFTPFMLGPLGLSYAGFMVLTASAFASRVAVLPLLGRMVERRGTGPLMTGGAVAIVPLPALWLVSHDFVYLLVLQLFAGVAWAAVELATLLSFFERIHDHSRASVLTAYNLLSAASVALGALVGSQVMLGLDGGMTAYAGVFVVSATGRLLTLPLLRRAPATGPEHTDLQLRTLAVRPSAGAVQRPVLATLPEEGRGEDDHSER